MKWTLLLVCLAVVLCGAYATSPPRCPNTCNPDQCPPLNPNPCPCGSYKGSCGCCDFCYACRGEECNKVASQKCEGDEVCQIPSGYSYSDVLTGRVSGVCPQ
ncbi:8.6 kDa transglutaminase substrate-like [Limulus polyphemus]|uniref:8.6 kDa transglutaminase substrate-like n=1 Tax=Limulus polyphemus TaxID=6850 RepID=A0ABM1BRR8_LIMPO|nr:8.6 kDa transglutaminase substrate-like [Limulus polyphemus]XP_013787396.1 8.6 kDa transglutaminase substrate-like [Limulus polyphemus]